MHIARSHSKTFQGWMEHYHQLVLKLSESPLVHIKDVPTVEQKLCSLVEGGADNLHVVSDFDMTLTKYWHNGQRSVSTHGVLMRSTLASNEFRQKTQALYDKYYPIEVSDSLSITEKTPFMKEWWTQAHELVLELGFTQSDLSQVVRETPVVWRPGMHEVKSLCAALDIPVLVFSAGLGDIIEEVLKEANLLTPNLHVIANKVKYCSQTGRCESFYEPLIHVFNKNEAALANTPYFDQAAHRTNVLLMGDSIGDLRMSHGLKHTTCLTVGFLNHDRDTLLGQYEDAFDIVILEDSSFDPVMTLLQAVAKGGGRESA